MKTTLIWLSVCITFFATARDSHGQIRDDDASTNYLALRCGTSAGTSALNYAEYGAKLARTIGELDMSQQQRVFGYVPIPVRESQHAIAGADGPMLVAQTPATLADSLLAGDSILGTPQAGGSPSDDVGTSLQNSAEVEGSLQGSADAAGGATVPAETEEGSGADSGVANDAGIEGEAPDADKAMPRGYDNLQEWLSTVIERFEAKYLP